MDCACDFFEFARLNEAVNSFRFGEMARNLGHLSSHLVIEKEPFDRVGMFERSKGKSIAELLDTFATRRQESLHELNEMKLTPTLLEKRGKHPELGVVTLKQLLATWVVHDLGHVRQIVRVMAKQYRDTVGPWRAYLSILEE